MKKLLLITMLLIASVVSAEPKHIGLDILGLAKQDVKSVIASLEGPTAIGVLQGTFGNTNKNITELLKTGKVSAVRFHLLNGPCNRNKRCEAGEPKPNDFRAIATRAKDVALIMDKFPAVKCFISPVLEHDEKNQATVNNWFKLVKEVAPNCKRVCSSFLGWCPSDSDILKEKHGNNPGAWDIVSNDGASIFQSDSKKYRTFGKNINFAWYEEMNLLYDGYKGDFVPPTKRTCKSTTALYKQAYKLLQAPKENTTVPAVCKNVIEIKKPELEKVNAESYCNADTRGNKALFILNKKYADTIDILAPSGKKIGCVKYYGMYENKQYRYYIGTCSNSNPVEVFEKAGNQETIYLKVNSDTCYKANAIRRLGFFK